MPTLPTVAINRGGHKLIINAADHNPAADPLWDDDDNTEATKPNHITSALALINGTDVARDMAIIPTIGQAAAKVIIERRPEGGYESLVDVWERCPELLIGRFKVDPGAVETWGAG